MLQRLLHFFQIDRTLIYALGGRVWQILTGPVTIVLLVQMLTDGERGIYCTLIGLSALQNFFELGYLNVLISQAGRAVGESTVVANGADNENTGTEAPMDARYAIAGLLQASTRWFRLVALTFFFVAIGIGLYSLRKNLEPIAWHWPMFSYLCMVAANFYLAPRIAIFEGSGSRALVYRMQLCQFVTGTFAVWLSLILGGKLWTLVISSAVQLFWAILFLFFKPPALIAQVSKIKSMALAVHPAELGFNQRRMAIYSFTFYLATQLYVILIMTFHGEVEAGRIGMTVMVVSAIQIVAMAWLQTKYSLISTHHGAGEHIQAGALWRKSLIISSLILLVLLFDLQIVLFLIARYLPGKELGFVTPLELAIYSAGCIANHFVAAQTSYVMARRSNPLTVPATTGFLLTTLAVVTGAYYQGNFGMLAGYAGVMCVFTLPVHTLTYLKVRKNMDLSGSQPKTQRNSP
jgi:hypothetical protein